MRRRRGGQAVRGGGTASVPLYAVGGGESRREGRGHTAVLYSHRYRGGFSIAFLQRWETEGEKGGGGGEHHISVILSQHVNVMHVLIELEGHVLRGSYGLKLSSKRGL